MSQKGGKSPAKTGERDTNDYIEKRCTSVHSYTDSIKYKDLSDFGGKKRKIDIECPDSDSSTDTIELVTGTKFPWPSEDGDSATSGSLYGLNPEYLKSLGITPPLDKWIHVTNFRCDKSELKETLELAGRVIMCAVIAIRERYAKVMYSHPLEAVQAVSMLNGQTFYGQKLKVIMVPSPTDTVILPKGLVNVGPGLGIKGKPLVDIVNQYNKFVKLKESLVDTTIFSHGDHKHREPSNYDSKKKKLSKASDSSSLDDEKTTEDSNVRRIMSFKVKSVEELQDDISTICDLYDAISNSPSPDIDKQNGNDEQNLSSKNLQIRPSFQIPTIKPSNSSNRNSSKGSTPSPVFGSKQRTMPFQPSLGPASNNTAGFNCSNPIGPPGVNMRPIGPQGMKMGGPGMMMNPSGPSGPRMVGPGPVMGGTGPVMGGPGLRMGGPGPVMGGPGPVMGGPAPGMGGPGPVMGGPGPVMGGPVPGMGGPGPIRMNMGLGPGHVMNVNGPGGFGPSGLMPPGVGPSPAPVQPATSDSFGLEFGNLPPSTTFPLLSEKVSRCGQVLSVQLTTPGCAVARFSTRAGAERCFQVFNGLCIDGCVIKVRFM